MNKQTILSILLLLALIPVATASEQLHYRLSYSGLITGFFWKRLADVTFNLTPERVTFRGSDACQISMEVDTRGYRFAEIFHPVRYRWESTLDLTMQRTLLSRTIDNGASDLHEVAWYDWQNRSIALFRKRKQQKDHDPSAEKRWEQDTYDAPPPFIDQQLVHPDGHSNLIQTEHLTGALSAAAIDPLAMIARVRHHPFESEEPLLMLVALDEELKHYRAHLAEQGELKIGKRHYPDTLKLEIRRANNNGRKGAMQIWLNNDHKRHPLRIDIKAPLGMIHLELMRIEERHGTTACVPTRIEQDLSTVSNDPE